MLAAVAFLLGCGVPAVRRGLDPALGDATAVAALLVAVAVALAPARGWIVCAALLLGLARAPQRPPAVVFATRPVVLDGRCLAWQPLPEGGIRGWLDTLCSPDGRALDREERRLAFTSPQSDAVPALGATLRVAGVLVATPAGTRLERACWLARSGGATPVSVVTRWRHALRLHLQARLPAGESALACSLVLGDPLSDQEELAEAYRRLGLLHILAVSGMHLWLYDVLLRRLLPRRLAALRWPALLLAALLSGGEAPVMRALSAVLLRDGMAARGRRVSAWTLWAAALWVEVALVPPRPADIGLLLSYAATAGLIAAPAARTSAWLRRVLQPSLAAFAATAPWMHALQGTVEPWTVLLTPLLAPLFPLRLALYALACTPLGGVCNPVLHAVRAAEGAVLGVAERLPGSPWAMPQVPTAAVAAAAAAVLMTLTGTWPRAPAARATGAVLALALLVLPAPRRPGLVVLPVGHGLAAVIAGDRESFAFDLGSADLRPRRLLDAVLLPELARRHWPLPAQGATSHPDSDHTNALQLLEERHGLRRLAAGPGQTLDLPELRPLAARLVGVRPALDADRNGSGMVLELRGPRFRAVLLGDQYGHALRQLTAVLEPGPLDVLLLPHHGLTTDGLPELLDHLRPRMVWAACGRNDWPLPAAAVAARRGIALRTTLEGPLALP